VPATGDPQLGEDFEEALAYAVQAHRGQLRKGTGAPYTAHLLAVSSLVLEHGGDEQTAIAALLHDAAEDQGGEERLGDIEHRFGERVAEIVAACSDTFETPKPPWRERKEAYLDHLVEADPDALLVSAADKLHNARSILADHREQGEELWSIFTTESASDQLWYYRSLVDAFQCAEARKEVGEGFERLVGKLDRVVTTLEERVPVAQEG
jgi:(p)ppGpp synthase/HD superfamily hydrolase